MIATLALVVKGTLPQLGTLRRKIKPWKAVKDQTTTINQNASVVTRDVVVSSSLRDTANVTAPRPSVAELKIAKNKPKERTM